MDLFEITRQESHPVYQEMEISNGNRQYDFLRSIVVASLAVGRPFLSHSIIKALNFHAIVCLHSHAGEYRPCEVTVGQHNPPAYYRVQALMDDFINEVNRRWENTDPVWLSTYALWKINNVHPFINGNGRTARAAGYFILCLQFGGWLPGAPILPELIKMNRAEYCDALQHAHTTFDNSGQPDLSILYALVVRLLEQQAQSAGFSASAAKPQGPTLLIAP